MAMFALRRKRTLVTSFDQFVGHGRSRASRWSNGVADMPRRYWSLIKLDFERTERIRDSICKRGGRADRATFADTLNAERIERRW